MKRTIKLPHDGFQKALKINGLLAEGWSITQDPDDEDVVIIEKTDATNESLVSRPQPLLD